MGGRPTNMSSAALPRWSQIVGLEPRHLSPPAVHLPHCSSGVCCCCCQAQTRHVPQPRQILLLPTAAPASVSPQRRASHGAPGLSSSSGFMVLPGPFPSGVRRRQHPLSFPEFVPANLRGGGDTKGAWRGAAFQSCSGRRRSPVNLSQ